MCVTCEIMPKGGGRESSHPYSSTSSPLPICRTRAPTYVSPEKTATRAKNGQLHTVRLVRQHRLVIRNTAGQHLNVLHAHKTALTGALLQRWQRLASLLRGEVRLELVLLRLERLLAARLADVLEADADALAQRASADRLVDDHAHTTRRDVPHDAGAAVVVLVRHARTHRGVSDDIDVVTHLHRRKNRRHRRRAMLAELLREEVAGAALVAVRVDHVCLSSFWGVEAKRKHEELLCVMYRWRLRQGQSGENEKEPNTRV